MAVGRPIMGILALFFTAGAVLLMFLTLLGGATNHTPLDNIYFLQVNTSNIPGAPASSRWTFWQLCAVRDGRSKCGSSHPNFPFAPPDSRNFDTDVNIPEEFINTNHYWLMSRFMFPFMIIGLFLAVLSLLLGLVAPCTRIGSYMSSLLAWLAWVFQVITSSLMTACFVKGRNNFNRNGQNAHLGKKAFAFMWTAVFCLTLATMFYCLGGALGRRDEGYIGREERRGFFAPRRSSSGASMSQRTFRGPRKEYA
ncbi:hypothetical protein VTN31DRAFT_3920 [Thermomyces dupontii]|uniref:uncharacterized protein n=1 Tax=Talaromyces thermophilus TaxID=28565 RepID=UPI0037440D91